MVISKTLERSSWREYFDQASKGLAGKGVEIEIITEDFGCQPESTLSKLFGFSYDDIQDEFQISSESMEHSIHSPREISVAEEGPTLTAMEIRENDGTRHIIRILEARS